MKTNHEPMIKIEHNPLSTKNPQDRRKTYNSILNKLAFTLTKDGVELIPLREKFQVQFSGFPPTHLEKVTIQKFGGRIVSQRGQFFTILVMEKCYRTVKYLLAMNFGAIIVGRDWIQKCLEKGCLVWPENELKKI